MSSKNRVPLPTPGTDLIDFAAPVSYNQVMHSQRLGTLSLASLALTLIWIIAMIVQTAKTGPIATPEQAVAVAAHPTPLFIFTYLNTLLLTGLVGALFFGLSVHFRPELGRAAGWGIPFTALYVLLNIVAYGSQIAWLPVLSRQPGISEIAVARWVQCFPGSMIALVNGLAYALLGIPSALYAAGFWKRGWKTIALLLAGNGVACILGWLGLLLHHAGLAFGVVLGGILFLAALAPMTRYFLRNAG